MKILVVGGAGYVGSHQVKLLCDKGYEVVVLDNLSTGFEKLVDKRATLIKGDVRDRDLLLTILNDIDVIYHFAALSLVGESINIPINYYDNNVYGMQILLEGMLECNVDKIIFSSTAAVYGKQNADLISEEAIPLPINPYGETKLAMEKMIKWVSNVSNIKYACLRYFNVAGASFDATIGELHDPETHLIPNVLKAIINDTNVYIYGDDYDTPDGTCIRDYIHVCDLVDAHFLAMEYLINNNENITCNLGYSKGTSVKEIIDSCQRVTKKVANRTIIEKRAGDPNILVSDNKLALTKLNWQPKHNDIDTIIRSAYNFYKGKE